MRRASITRRLALAGAPLALLATGCVPQDRYDALLNANNSIREQLVAAEAERDATRNDLEIARSGVEQVRGENTTLRSRVAQLDDALVQLEEENAQNIAAVSSMEFGPLPQGVTRALSRLAESRPDLLQFDAERGMVRFSSDLTFALGSDSVSGDATAAIQQIAGVLNLPDASGLAIEVVGHTDNVPISRPATRQRHPSNLHLSVHRAIAVQRALVSAGVTAGRVKVAGYGQTRPVVPNPASGGAAANRRVEVFLVPADPGMTFAAAERTLPQAPAPTGPATNRQPATEPLK